jgi:hypothetical protein
MPSGTATTVRERGGYGLLHRLDTRSLNLVPLLCILLSIVLANLLPLLHVVTKNPLVLNASLNSGTHSVLPGKPYTDPNAGYTTQSLGHLAALDWIHGHVPWWNPFEGIGSPLAGEMQSGAFFPPTILLVFHDGLLYLQLALELVAGSSTYFLVRRLGVGRLFSTAAGTAFGLCGTFAWLAHAPIRPMALLPLCLLGVERAVDAANGQRAGGWHLLALALALSVLAGFPETTFLDATFVALWAILRIFGPGREEWRRLLGKLSIGTLVGACLSGPLIIAFADYLPYANTGGHTGGLSHTAVRSTGLVQLILPYSLGPLGAFGPARGTRFPLFPGTPGYLPVTLIAAGLVGLLGQRHRVLRLGLAGWIAICLLRTYGFLPVMQVLAHVPGIRQTAFYLWADPSWELAVVVLAALGLDDIARHFGQRRAMVLGVILTGLAATWAALTALPLLAQATGPTGGFGEDPRDYPLVSLGFACGALLLLALGAVWARRPATEEGVDSPHRLGPMARRGRILMAGAVSLEAMLLFGFATLSAPTTAAPLQEGSVSWLQAHLGTSRFVTLGQLSPTTGPILEFRKSMSTIFRRLQRGFRTSPCIWTPILLLRPSLRLLGSKTPEQVRRRS